MVSSVPIKVHVAHISVKYDMTTVQIVPLSMSTLFKSTKLFYILILVSNTSRWQLLRIASW